MRPIELVIEGLRSFRTPVTIDFADRNQLAIVGDTGAGKSSILDAITYALYRQTTFTKQPIQELMNATATQLRVVLKFRVSEQTWVVTRALRRRKAGVEAETPELGRVDDSGEKVETLAGMSDVAERIQLLIGLDADAFLRTAVLPQGNFARLLIADRPADRATVLRQVWRTDELVLAGKIAANAANDAERLRVKLDAEASKYPDDPDGYLKTLRNNRTTVRRKAQHAESDRDRMNAAVAKLEVAAKEAELGQGVLNDLDGMNVSELADPLDEIQSVEDEIAQADNKLLEENARIEEQLKEIAQDDEGPPLASVIKTVARLDQVENDISKLTDMKVRLHRLHQEKAAAESRASQARQRESSARRDAQKHTDSKGRLDEALAVAQQHQSDVEKKYAACEKRHTSLEAVQQTLLDLQRKVEALEDVKAHLDDEVKAKRVTKARKDTKLEAARRADCAASAAHGLHAGNPCPICDRRLPVDWHPPAGARIDDVETEARVATAALQEIEKRMAEVDGSLASENAAYDDVQQQVEDASTGFQDVMQVLREVLPSVGSALPAREAALEPLSDNVAKAQSTIEHHDQEQSRLVKVLADATADTASTKAQADGLAKRADDTHRDLNRDAATVRITLEDLPPQFRPGIALTDDGPSDFDAIDTADLDAKREAARARQAKLEKVENGRRALEDRKKEINDARTKLNHKREREVVAPLEDLSANANELLSTITLAVGHLSANQRLPVPAKAELAALRPALVEIEEALDSTRRAARTRVDSAEKNRQNANTALAEFAKRIDVFADNPDAIAKAAEDAHVEAQAEKRQAERAYDDFKAIVAHVRQLRAVRTRAVAKEQALSALDAALKDGAFLKWLTLRRSRSLLSHASVVLKQMSGGRYAFADPDPEKVDAPWHVLDNDTGQARTPASLSGGEQFIASLALTLGMVEMMARSGGKLESLFLDEGFGSLDRNNLDAAVEALSMVAARGRMVGVISHVRAVAEQFDNVLAVTREEGGSRAVWLSNQQRQDIATDALSGLLD